MRKSSTVLLCLLLIVGLQLSCDDLLIADFPEVSTPKVDIKDARTTFSAIITADDLSEITGYGFIWSDTRDLPEIGMDSSYEVGQIPLENEFVWESSDWDSDVLEYQVYAYIKLRNDIKYGDSETFTLRALVLVMNDADVFVSNDSVGLSGFMTVVDSTKFDKVLDNGHLVSTSNFPQIGDEDVIQLSNGEDDNQRGFVVRSSTVLNYGTDYYARAFAVIAGDTFYSNTIKFETLDGWNRLEDFEFAFSHGVADFYKGSIGVMGMGCENVCGPNYQLWSLFPESQDSNKTKVHLTYYFGLGSNTSSGVGFISEDKFYFGLGEVLGASENTYSSEFHSYDLTQDPDGTWDTLIHPFPGVARSQSIGVMFDNKAYVGFGQKDGNAQGGLWVFDPDPVEETWNLIDNIPQDLKLSGIYGASAFATNEAVYIACGKLADGGLTDMVRRFDPKDTSNSSWTVVKQLFPGQENSGNGKRWQGTGFSIEGKLYYGFGTDVQEINYYKDFYVLDDPTDDNSEWTQIAQFPGEARYGAVAFVANGIAYVGSGISLNGQIKDFWRYTPRK